VKDEVYDSHRHGVYEVTAADGKTWTRATDMNDAAEFAYGTRIVVTNGTVNAGRAFYVVNKQDVYGGAFTVNTTLVGINPEPAANPDIALLTAAAMTVTNAIVVTNNQSSGTAKLGGATAHASAFSGTTTLYRAAQVTAAAGGVVTFLGDIVGNFGVTKVGPGTVIFPHPMSYTGPTIAAEGVLAGAFSLPGPLVVTNGGAINCAGTNSAGIATVSNNVAFTAGSTFAVDITNAVAGTGYDQLRMTGALELSGGALQINLGSYIPQQNAEFTIISGATSSSGSFAQGRAMAASESGATWFSINTHGGSGNDVVLTVLPVGSVITIH
jgi:hypothetical protein